MSGEVTYVTSAQTNVITGSATLASNGFNGSAECNSLSSTTTGKYPSGDLALFASFSASVSSASNVINVYRRDLNIDSTNSAPIPQSAAPAYSSIPVGSFLIPPFTATSTGYFFLPDVPLPATSDCQFYIENKTNSAIATNYTLKITPKTYIPAA